MRNALVVLLLAAVAVAALVDGLRGGSGAAADDGRAAQADGGSGQPLEGPAVPAPRALPGWLTVVDDDCRLRVVSFDDVVLGAPGPETLCRAWPSPAGRLAAVTVDRGGRADLRQLALVRLDDPPAEADVIGEARGEPVWSPDGRFLAWCGIDERTVVLAVADGTRRIVDGCSPRFAPDGSVLTRPDRALAAEILRDGQPLLGPEDIARGFSPDSTGPVNVIAFDASADGLLAVTAVRIAPLGTLVVLELWRSGALEAAFELPTLLGPGNSRFGGYLRFSPAGNELVVGYTAGGGEITVVDLNLQRILVRSVSQRGFAWSPDGAWLALAVDGEIRIYGALRDEPTYVLPISTPTVGWGAEEEAPADG